MTISAGRLELETPDHVVLRYDLAGVGNRGFAAIIDVVIVLVIAAAVLFLLGLATISAGSTPFYTGAVILLTFFFIWGYFIVLEWLWQGQTIGKRITGLRVVNEDGSPARFVAVLVRNIVRIADFMPTFYVVGVITIIVSPRSQRLGDLAAGTYVVRAPKPRIDFASLRTIARTAAAPNAPTDAVAARRLSGEAQRIVREFVSREAQLPLGDRKRVAAGIAARLRPVTPEIDVVDDVEFIRALARSMRAAGE